MHIAHLARAENELFASALEDELRLVFREHVRGAVVLLRQLLLPLHHLAGEANDHVVLIGLSVNRDGAECGPFDLHGLILVPGLRTRLLTPMSSLRCHRCRLKALGSRRSQTPDGSTSFRPQTQLYSMRRREWSRPAKSMIPCSWADVPKAKVLLDDRCTGGPAATDGVLWRRPGAPAIGAAHTVLVGKSRPVVCRRRVGALGWPSFFEAQEYRAIAAVRPPSLNCSETTAPRSCAPRATQRRQRQARLAKPRTRRNRFLLRPMLCSAIAGCPTQDAAAAVKSPVSARKRTCGGGHSV